MSMHKGLIGKSEGSGSVGDKTLGDYIVRKQRQDAFDAVAKENKLTFDEWYTNWYNKLPQYRGFVNREDIRAAWTAAQENK